jgi:hypothetical protein
VAVDRHALKFRVNTHRLSNRIKRHFRKIEKPFKKSIFLLKIILEFYDLKMLSLE